MSFGKNSGQFFSLMTIIMVLPLLALAATFSQGLSGYGEELGSLVRLKSAYYYYDSVDQDLLRAGEIVARRSVVAALNWVIENGEGLNSSEGILRELFEEGSINGSDARIMNRSTIHHWLNTTENISRERGYRLNLSLDFSEESIGMKTPWKITFGLNYSLTLTDRNRLFTLRRNLSKEIPIPVTDLEDPLITLRTGGKVVYPIQKAPFSYFTRRSAVGRGNNSWAAGESVILPPDEDVIDQVTSKDEKVLVTNQSVSQSLMNDFAGVVIKNDADLSGFNTSYVVNIQDDYSNISNHTRVVVEGNAEEVWEIQNLYQMWEKGYYVQGDGPSFLDRLENNLTNSYPGKGLLVFLKKEDLESVGLEVKDRSNLAHIYFSEEPVENYRVKGLPQSFRIDGEHLEDFGVNNTLSF